MSLHTWAQKWGVGIEAFRDLQITLGTYTPALPADAPGVGKSEAWVQSAVRIEASQKGCHLFRNNVGALPDSTGRIVRYGLGNDSPAMNAVLKSSDLIGWCAVLIQPEHVGHVFARFTAREVKAPNWQFKPGDKRAQAQLAFLNLVNAAGGDAAFATGPGSL